MPANLAHPTPYVEVNALLNQLLSGAQAVLGDYFVGMYLYGSLASGDFDLQRSDIDFVVVTDGELPGELIQALEAMHARLAASGSKWAAKLEGSYIPQQSLRLYDPGAPPLPQINEGHFYVSRHGSDWVIQRHILREHGVIVAGPAVAPLIDPVRPDDLRQAVRGILREWWEPILHDPGWLRSSEYQAYAVLTMCRALYTLQHGIIASKTVSARWARDAMGDRFAALIEWALAWKHDEPPDKLAETLALIRHTVERSRLPVKFSSG